MATDGNALDGILDFPDEQEPAEDPFPLQSANSSQGPGPGTQVLLANRDLFLSQSASSFQGPGPGTQVLLANRDPFLSQSANWSPDCEEIFGVNEAASENSNRMDETQEAKEVDPIDGYLQGDVSDDKLHQATSQSYLSDVAKLLGELEFDLSLLGFDPPLGMAVPSDLPHAQSVQSSETPLHQEAAERFGLEPMPRLGMAETSDPPQIHDDSIRVHLGEEEPAADPVPPLSNSYLQGADSGNGSFSNSSGVLSTNIGPFGEKVMSGDRREAATGFEEELSASHYSAGTSGLQQMEEESLDNNLVYPGQQEPSTGPFATQSFSYPQGGDCGDVSFSKSSGVISTSSDPFGEKVMSGGQREAADGFGQELLAPLITAKTSDLPQIHENISDSMRIHPGKQDPATGPFSSQSCSSLQSGHFGGSCSSSSSRVVGANSDPLEGNVMSGTPLDAVQGINQELLDYSADTLTPQSSLTSEIPAVIRQEDSSVIQIVVDLQSGIWDTSSVPSATSGISIREEVQCEGPSYLPQSTLASGTPPQEYALVPVHSTSAAGGLLTYLLVPACDPARSSKDDMVEVGPCRFKTPVASVSTPSQQPKASGSSDPAFKEPVAKRQKTKRYSTLSIGNFV